MIGEESGEVNPKDPLPWYLRSITSQNRNQSCGFSLILHQEKPFRKKKNPSSSSHRILRRQNHSYFKHSGDDGVAARKEVAFSVFLSLDWYQSP